MTLRGIVVALTLALPLALATSRAEAAEPAWAFGLGAGALVPSASFADHADPAAAFEMFLRWHPPHQPWGVRVTGQWAQYAHSDTTYRLPGISVETRSSSDLWLISFGPEFTLGRERTRFVAHAGLGIARASTRTATRGLTSDVGETNLGDGALALEGGAALLYDILPKRGFAAEVGARWMRSGELDYVPDGGIRRAAGQLVLTSTRGSLDGAFLRFALSLAIAGKER